MAWTGWTFLGLDGLDSNFCSQTRPVWDWNICRETARGVRQEGQWTGQLVGIYGSCMECMGLFMACRLHRLAKTAVFPKNQHALRTKLDAYYGTLDQLGGVN